MSMTTMVRVRWDVYMKADKKRVLIDIILLGGLSHKHKSTQLDTLSFLPPVVA